MTFSAMKFSFSAEDEEEPLDLLHTSFRVRITKSTRVTMPEQVAFSNTENLVVDWGDGVQDTYVPTKPYGYDDFVYRGLSHTYSDPGEYVVRMSDAVSGLAITFGDRGSGSGLAATVVELIGFASRVSRIQDGGLSGFSSLPPRPYAYCAGAAPTLGAMAFQRNPTVVSLTGLSEAISKYVGKFCFRDCSSLLRIDGVRVYPKSEGEFMGCRSLETVALSSGPAEQWASGDVFGPSVFEGCSSLVNCVGLMYPDRVASASRLFCGCTSIAEIGIQIGDDVIGTPGHGMVPKECFRGCSSLTSILGCASHAYGDGCFRESGVLGFAGLPFTSSSGTYSFGSRCFMDCTAFSSVRMPGTVSEDASFRFSFGDECFRGCWSIPSLDGFPYGTFSLGYGVFRDCFLRTEDEDGLCTDVGLADISGFAPAVDVRSVPPYTFFGDRLIPDLGPTGGRGSLGDWCFSGCSGVKSIDADWSTIRVNYGPGDDAPDFSNFGVGVFSHMYDAPHLVVGSALRHYGGVVEVTSLAEMENVKGLNDSTFEGCMLLPEMPELPPNVYYFGDSCFRGCRSMKNLDSLGRVNIPSGIGAVMGRGNESHAFLPRFGKYCFADCCWDPNDRSKPDVRRDVYIPDPLFQPEEGGNLENVGGLYSFTRELQKVLLREPDDGHVGQLSIVMENAYESVLRDLATVAVTGVDDASIDADFVGLIEDMFRYATGNVLSGNASVWYNSVTGVYSETAPSHYMCMGDGTGGKGYATAFVKAEQSGDSGGSWLSLKLTSLRFPDPSCPQYSASWSSPFDFSVEIGEIYYDHAPDPLNPPKHVGFPEVYNQGSYKILAMPGLPGVPGMTGNDNGKYATGSIDGELNISIVFIAFRKTQDALGRDVWSPGSSVGGTHRFELQRHDIRNRQLRDQVVAALTEFFSAAVYSLYARRGTTYEPTESSSGVHITEAEESLHALLLKDGTYGSLYDGMLLSRLIGTKDDMFGEGCFSGNTSLDIPVAPSSEHALNQSGFPEISSGIPSRCFEGSGQSSLAPFKYVRSIGSYAFARTPISSLAGFPKSVFVVSEGCFSNCLNIVSLGSLPGHVKATSARAFDGCVGLSGMARDGGDVGPLLEESSFSGREYKISYSQWADRFSASWKFTSLGSYTFRSTMFSSFGVHQLVPYASADEPVTDQFSLDLVKGVLSEFEITMYSIGEVNGRRGYNDRHGALLRLHHPASGKDLVFRAHFDADFTFDSGGDDDNPGFNREGAQVSSGCIRSSAVSLYTVGSGEEFSVGHSRAERDRVRSYRFPFATDTVSSVSLSTRSCDVQLRRGTSVCCPEYWYTSKEARSADSHSGASGNMIWLFIGPYRVCVSLWFGTSDKTVEVLSGVATLTSVSYLLRGICVESCTLVEGVAPGDIVISDVEGSVGQHCAVTFAPLFPLLTTIGVGCFENCNMLKNLDGFPPSVNRLPDRCFAGCQFSNYDNNPDVQDPVIGSDIVFPLFDEHMSVRQEVYGRIGPNLASPFSHIGVIVDQRDGSGRITRYSVIAWMTEGYGTTAMRVAISYDDEGERTFRLMRGRGEDIVDYVDFGSAFVVGGAQFRPRAVSADEHGVYVDAYSTTYLAGDNYITVKYAFELSDDSKTLTQGSKSLHADRAYNKFVAYRNVLSTLSVSRGTGGLFDFGADSSALVYTGEGDRETPVWFSWSREDGSWSVTSPRATSFAIDIGGDLWHLHLTASGGRVSFSEYVTPFGTVVSASVGYSVVDVDVYDRAVTVPSWVEFVGKDCFSFDDYRDRKPLERVTFDGKTVAQVRNMSNFPFGVPDGCVIMASDGKAYPLSLQ